MTIQEENRVFKNAFGFMAVMIFVGALLFVPLTVAYLQWQSLVWFEATAMIGISTFAFVILFGLSIVRGSGIESRKCVNKIVEYQEEIIKIGNTKEKDLRDIISIYEKKEKNYKAMLELKESQIEVLLNKIKGT